MDVAAGYRGWIERLERRPLMLASVALLVALVAAGAMAGAVAGFAQTGDAIARLAPQWIVVAVGARLLAYLGYTLAHHRVMTACEETELETATAARVVAFGSGATSLRGGFSIDSRVLRASGASRPRARAHVTALAMLEYAVLAAAAWVAALRLIGARGAQGMVVWPWVIGVPAGTCLATLLYVLVAPRFRRAEGSIRGRVRGLIEGGEMLARQARRPGRALAAAAGMALYWFAEIAALWASLRAFGIDCPPSVVTLGFATGYVLTPRGLPLAGAGLAEVLVPLSLSWLGVGIAAAIVAAFAAELTRLAVSFPFAMATQREVRELVEAA